MCARRFQKRLQKLRAKRIEIGQGLFTSCKRCLKFSELTGAIQDLAIHGKMCIQISSSYRHQQCFSWILGTGTHVCIVDKDLIFPPIKIRQTFCCCHWHCDVLTTVLSQSGQCDFLFQTQRKVRQHKTCECFACSGLSDAVAIFLAPFLTTNGGCTGTI